MNRLRKNITLLIILAFTLAAAVPALAAPSAQTATDPCSGDISGTIVDVVVMDDVVTVTVELEDGTTCPVTLKEEYDHPIVALLGSYFSDVDAEALGSDLQDAWNETFVCAQDIGGTWTWVPRENGDCPQDAQEVRVTSTDGEGNFFIEDPEAVGDPVPLDVGDPDAQDSLTGALEALSVEEWSVDGGSLFQAGDEIAQYHEDGMGFGVLVKLYAIVEETQADCEENCTTVQDLVDLFNTPGVGMGQIFADYGKPDKVGVGHVRQSEVGNEKANNGKAKGKDKGDDQPQVTDEPGEEPFSNGSSLPDQAQGKKDKDKGNNGKGQDKVKIKNQSNQSPGVCNAVAKSNGKGKGKGLSNKANCP